MIRTAFALTAFAVLSACVATESGDSGPAGPTVYQTEAGAVTILR